MKRYTDIVLNQFGNPIMGASCTVLTYPGNATATLFQDKTGAAQIANPVTTDAQGQFWFYAPNGRYSISFTGSGVTKETLTDVLIEDPSEANSYIVTGGSIDATPIGAITPSTGAFTTLTASTLVLSAYNGPVGTITPNAGTFTTLTATTLNVSGVATLTASAALLATNSSALLGSTWVSPGAIGLTTPNTAAFTTLSSTGTTTLGATTATSLNGTPIGATTPSTGAFTTISVSGGINSIAIGATTPSTGVFTTLMATSGINSTNIGATTPGTGAFTTLSATGMLTASGSITIPATKRIFGDFSSSTIASRVAFQDATTGNNTNIGILPNGIATTSAFTAYNISDPTNSGYVQLRATVSEHSIIAGVQGTGSYQPLSIYVNNSNRLSFALAGATTFYPTVAVPAGGTTGLGISLSSTANLGVYFGSGTPTLSAAQGSLYINTTGSSTSTRMYVNTNGTTGWTNVTTAA